MKTFTIAVVFAALATRTASSAPTAHKPPPQPHPAPPASPPPSAPTPWSEGVSADAQKQAQALLDEANELHAQRAYVAAVDKYRSALGYWDHPMIRFNLARALIKLDRILEAADELEHALRFGEAPFPTQDLYNQALEDQLLIKGRVGTVAASCDQAGVQVLLDGKPWFACPGSKQARVLAGAHAVLGERDGYLTSSQKLVVAGGEVSSTKLSLVSLDAAVTVVYPHKRWLPWSIAGGGAAIVLAGVGTYYAARSSLDTFQTELAATCPSGCSLSSQPTLQSDLTRARVENDVAIALWGVGGAAVVGGLVFAVVNRPKRIVPSLEVTHGGGTASLTWRY